MGNLARLVLSAYQASRGRRERLEKLVVRVLGDLEGLQELLGTKEQMASRVLLVHRVIPAFLGLPALVGFKDK